MLVSTMAIGLRAVLVTIFVLIVHAFAILNDVYTTIPWFDAMMHLAGGFAMGLVAVALWKALVLRAHIEGRGRLASFAPMAVQFMVVLGFVAMIGIGWEWFEFVLDHTLSRFIDNYGWAQASVQDTMADFFCDLVGGFAAFVLAKVARWL